MCLDSTNRSSHPSVTSVCLPLQCRFLSVLPREDDPLLVLLDVMGSTLERDFRSSSLFLPRFGSGVFPMLLRVVDVPLLF